jgi:hypothetical protein
MSVRGIDLAPQISGSDSGGMTIINTVAEMKTTSGSEPLIVYCEETAGIYRFCDNCDFTPDDDLVIATGSGGTTRWELLQKMTRSLGDTGWIDSDNATISAVSATKVRLSITTEAAIGIRGVRHPVPAGDYDITISGSPGIKFIHLLANMTLASRDTLWDFDTEVPVMIVYWSGTAIVAAPQTEFHGIRDNIWHKYTHEYIGLQYKSGLSFTGSVQTDNNVDPGATETVYNLWSTTGVVQDEDIQATPGTGQWAQTLGSGLTEATAAIFNHFYFNGTAIVSQAAMADRAPFIHAGANTPPQWNNGGTLEAAITGDFIVYHYFANPMVGGWGVFTRPHNAKYTSLAAALAASPTQLTWTNYAELKHIYTAIFRVNTGWANSHRCKLVSLRDFRTVAGTPVAATNPTAHSALTGLELAGPGVTYGHINDQPQTIAGAKTFSSTISGSIDGNAATVTNGVYTTGTQTVGGAKTFSSLVTVNLGIKALGLFSIGVDYSFGDFTGIQGTRAPASMVVLVATNDVNGAGKSALYIVNCRITGGNDSTSAIRVAGDADVSATFAYVATNILRITNTSTAAGTAYWRYLGGF